MASAEVVFFGDEEGGGEEGEDLCAEGVAGGLEAGYQGRGGGEGGREGLEGWLRWGDVEGFFWVALLRRGVVLLGEWR